jgi:tRNA(Arg) A34 adenosine deaminase TadA
MSDEAHMRAALALAREGAAQGEVPVGCLIVDENAGEIIAQAWNNPIGLGDPTAHAEILAIRRAAEKLGNYRLREGLTLFVTLEPCAMCAGAVSHARIARLVFGADDPKAGAVMHGPRYFDQPTCHWRPRLASGVCASECASLLRDFFQARR